MKVVVSGGGTGGHIYPALAFIRELQKHDQHAEVLYIGTEKGLESRIIGKEDIPFKTIEISGFKRSLSFENVRTVMRFISGTKKSRQYLKEFQPDVVLGTGGYVCGPVVYAATQLKIPTVVHEQNSVPGLTNKFLSRYVDKVALSFNEAGSFFPQQKTLLTGNPRASEVSSQHNDRAKKELGLDVNKPVVLIVGGSRGARPINDAFLKALNEVGKRDYQVLYITGDVHYDEVMKAVKLSNNPKNVVIKPFVYNMPEILGSMDCIVARAGATTLAEITALGLPSILIPSPYVTNNHQEKNARALSDHDAAILRLEQDLNSEQLLADIDKIMLDKDYRFKMSEKSRELGMPNAAMNLYTCMSELIKKH
ncbi:undecaprenyldiphospho-muramoylpentapeptide beta-N-acetylglucosaminyltransferase [Bacillus solimangrovi]|uniref:UDP-N-acetylglucosamine--N-acetylmuramyl-(pentapeptide) pyrophosphoryl-undecaprenol N-acetylglucosamine transferase n=1 Tax=Bacillus solimangrovi TaxID=1305675 RepID=A0A1E5LAZ5_9BACI|nr:undecaprenyldiphospho-muramoylpentapeptide beta-N-acetylglucosaminyltransferase [Bacillus solimangrovi]OEH91169.1 undecaprenyldiphospho-muramoylpentapeptide beta-N-acetylglucosaminyltransferase [Bacillus solimangrovi]